MKLTLLELTQNILSALNSDAVNSISDTVESQQVAECIKTTYMNMLGRYELPEHVKLINLEAAADITKPTLMYRPEGITRIEWIKYFNSNPSAGGTYQDQYGSYSHDLNLDITQSGSSPSTNVS